MEVIVKLHGNFREYAGTDTIKVPISDDETVDTLLMKLSRRHPKVVEEVLDPMTGDIRGNYDILLNGRRIQQIRGIYTKLKHKDEIILSPSEPHSGTSGVS
ncbi:MAG TPA: MoaD family protein [Hadesarchaea archaeon]|nr:MoaD family protein [Hadesarchaea archaeon]